MKHKENSKFIKQQTRNNNIVKAISLIGTWLIVLMFIALLGFIIYESIPGFKAYTFKGIFLTDAFNTASFGDHEASVWMPLTVTIIIGVGALLIATPLALKTTTFIFFRIKNKSIKKALKIIIEISAAIPSVIFGLFAYRSLGQSVKTVFGLEIANTVLTAIFMVAIMLIPTITLLSLNAYNAVDKNLIMNSMALGNSKTKAIYKVFRRQTRKAIIVAIIIAAGRVIGETMAVSMILSSESYTQVFDNGLIGILTSSLRPLGAVISKGMFAENGGPEFRGLLFAFGLIMFVVVLILNSIVIVATNDKRNNSKFINISNKIGTFFTIVPNSLNYVWCKIMRKEVPTLDKDNISGYNVQKYMNNYIKYDSMGRAYNAYKITWEYIATAIVLCAIGWICLDVLVKGLVAIASPTSTVFAYTKDTTGQAFVNTLILILTTVAISFPLTLFIAIGLNEYAKNGPAKKTILFLIDCIGATPSIIFGMFGLILFIETLHLSSGGAMGNSLLAGSLTMMIVILPTFIRMNQQALQSVSNDIRESGYSLGNSKWYVIRTLVLPHAYSGLLSSIILTIGRILAETAPLYITAGLSSSSTIALMNPSQTLTTRIYAQLSGSNSVNSNNIMYESALIALLLVFIIILISYLVIPNWKELKKFFTDKIEIYKALRNQEKHDINLEKYKSQIKGSYLYLSEDQAKNINIDNNYIWKYQDQFIKTVIISEQEIKRMQREFILLNQQ